MQDIPMDTFRALRVIGYNSFSSYANDNGFHWDVREQSWVDTETGVLKTIDEICARIQSDANYVLGVN